MAPEEIKYDNNHYKYMKFTKNVKNQKLEKAQKAQSSKIAEKQQETSDNDANRKIFMQRDFRLVE